MSYVKRHLLSLRSTYTTYHAPVVVAYSINMDTLHSHESITAFAQFYHSFSELCQQTGCAAMMTHNSAKLA